VPTAPPVEDGALPRLWTVFAAYLGMLAACAGLVFVAISALASRLAPDAAFFAFLVLVQAAIGGAAIIPALLSREPFRTRLGIVRPAIPAWGYLIFALASTVPWTVGSLLGGAAESLSGFDWGGQGTGAPVAQASSIPFVLFVALGPGLFEELLFRGYIQRRLLRRWSPPVAILASSLLFAALHIGPREATFAFVLGLWLGVLAWWTGSIWPGVVCHAVGNGVATAVKVVVAAYSGGDPSSDVVVAMVGIVIIGLIVLGLASFPLAVRRAVAMPRAGPRRSRTPPHGPPR
jgi:membrane protease YdiL (CAAX protease family)